MVKTHSFAVTGPIEDARGTNIPPADLAAPRDVTDAIADLLAASTPTPLGRTLWSAESSCAIRQTILGRSRRAPGDGYPIVLRVGCRRADGSSADVHHRTCRRRNENEI
jgi:hypothetical protein